MTYPGYPTGQQAFQQQGQYGMPPGYAPMPTNQQYMQQPMQPAYPGFAPAPQQPMQMPQMPQGGDLNARVPNDPSIPQELRGKTWGEAMRYYGIMREDFVNRQQQRQVPQQPQQQQFQPIQNQQQPQPRSQAGWGQQQNQQQMQQVDPVRQAVSDVLSEALPQYLAPIVQPIQQQNLLNTYNGVKGRFQDWAAMEQDIISSMQSADAQTLNNPQAWEAAYYHAKGKAMTQRQLGPGPQQPQQGQPNYGPPMPQQQYQQSQMPVYQAPQQGYQGPLGNQFVEGPTPPAPGMHAQQQDPRDEAFARRFNMPVEVYRSWKGGNIGLMQQPRQQQIPQMNGQNMQQPFGQLQMIPQQQMPQQFGGGQFVPPGYYQPQQNGGNGYAP